MREEIYNFYVNNLSSKKLVFKYMRFRWYGFNIVAIITFIYSMTFFITKHIKSGLIASVPFIIYYTLINYWAKGILKNRYRIEHNEFIWANSLYYKLRKDLLIKYLKNKNVYTEKKLKGLIAIYFKDVEKKKYKGFINWGILLAIFIPLWAQFLAALFKVSANTLNDVLQVFFSILAIITFIFIMVSVMRSMLNDFIDDFINKESNRFKKLASMLEEILFEIDIEG